VTVGHSYELQCVLLRIGDASSSFVHWDSSFPIVSIQFHYRQRRLKKYLKTLPDTEFLLLRRRLTLDETFIDVVV